MFLAGRPAKLAGSLGSPMTMCFAVASQRPPPRQSTGCNFPKPCRSAFGLTGRPANKPRAVEPGATPKEGDIKNTKGPRTPHPTGVRDGKAMRDSLEQRRFRAFTLRAQSKLRTLWRWHSLRCAIVLGRMSASPTKGRPIKLSTVGANDATGRGRRRSSTTTTSPPPARARCRLPAPLAAASFG